MGWFSSFFSPIAEVFQSVADVVSDVVDTTVEAVSDLGSSVDDFVREEIPGGWATVVTVANPALGPVASGAQTLSQGGDIGDALLSAGMNYGGQQLVGAIGGPSSGASTGAEWLGEGVPSGVPQWDSAFTNAGGSLPTDIFTDTVKPTDFKPDYSLTSGAATPNTGLQVPPQTGNVFLPDGSIDYGFNVPAAEGLVPSAIPSLPGMGGGQGLVATVPGGTVSETGFIPTGAPMNLGDPSSFINGGPNTGNPLQDRVLDKVQSELLNKALGTLLGGAAGGLMTQGTPPPTPIPAYQQANNMPAYTPEYFQAVQQNYNNIVPQGLMKDVATPLQQWYQPPASVVDKLFGGST